ncbi:MAG TPA: DEAD/DEAH box helicase, partial [Thermoleophilaceae bacterium]|nr:DEAD/DEAH box helicase [Thermoleophilaceae bacterium]
MSGRRIDAVARDAFGFEALRPGQREAIESVLDGRDTLVVMSTGSGKSAIYEIAGFIKAGATVVISPLIALQRDQIEKIERRIPGEAAGINSNVAEGDRREAFEEFRGGELEYLFLAPEQLANEEVLAQVREAAPSLIVVDEAHSISEWGHDFRPDYLRLGAFIAEMGHPTILALTATASPPVREEIVERLKMRDPFVVVRGFDRPNIWLGVE